MTDPGEARPILRADLPAPVRREMGDWKRGWAMSVLAVAVFLTLWQIIGSILPPFFISTPSSVLRGLWDLTFPSQGGPMLYSGPVKLASGLTKALGESILTFVFGFLAAAVIGVVIGLLMGRSRVIEHLFDPFVSLLYSTPKIALIPLIVIWFGVGLKAKALVVFLSALFPIIVPTYIGAKHTSPVLIEAAQAFGVSRRGLFRRVVLPSTLPYIVAGLRLAVGRALVGMVVAEMLLEVKGLGSLLRIYGAQFDTAKVFAIIVVLAALGLGIVEGIKLFERRVAPWRETASMER